MPYCLIKPLADRFKKALQEGKIDPEKLSDMSSAERHTFFEDLIGKDNAGQVNALFESKLLLKDMEKGMITWAKQVTGIKPDVRNDLISRIQKMDDRILNPAGEKAFLEDLANKRLGTDVTMEEAKRITELSKNLSEAKKNIATDRIAYGVARVEMQNYINDIKRENNKMTLNDLKMNPAGSVIKVASGISGFAKSLKASLDVSAFGRQGFKTMFTHTKTWAADAGKTFLDIWTTLKEKTSEDTAMNAIKADVYSREFSIDGTYKRMGLDIGNGEEAFPTSLPEKIPALGRLFKASEVAYQGFLLRLRADIADQYIKIATNNGVDLKNPEEAKAIGRLVNSLTGRGSLGPLESAGKVVNTMFFSPKNVKANFDFLTAHTFEKTSGFARRAAAINLIKVIAGTAAIFAVAKALNSDSVELDPRSSDFGKIRIGDTRFDASGGMSSIATLASRLVMMSSKSSVSGKVSDLGSGYGQTSPIEVLMTFAGNKLSPVASILRDLINRTDYSGNPLTATSELSNLLMPLPITNAHEALTNPKAAPAVITIIMDAFGIATNTYSDTSSIAVAVEDEDMAKQLHDLSNAAEKSISFTNWDTTKRADIAAFKEKHPDKFDDAKTRYTNQVKTQLEKLFKNQRFQNLSDTDKVRAVNQIDTDAVNKVFSQFQFHYHKAKLKKLNF